MQGPLAIFQSSESRTSCASCKCIHEKQAGFFHCKYRLTSGRFVEFLCNGINQTGGAIAPGTFLRFFFGNWHPICCICVKQIHGKTSGNHFWLLTGSPLADPGLGVRCLSEACLFRLEPCSRHAHGARHAMFGATAGPGDADRQGWRGLLRFVDVREVQGVVQRLGGYVGFQNWWLLKELLLYGPEGIAVIWPRLSICDVELIRGF